MEDERIIELTDDEGGKERFIFLTTLERDGRQFAILTPEEAENEDEEAIVVLEMLEGKNDEEMELVSVDDDDLAEAVFNEYLEMVEEEEEGDGGTGDEDVDGHE